jgi:RND family efflux transporter MFP subunit
MSTIERVPRLWLFGALLAMAAQPALALELNGQLEWSRRVELSTSVSGVVERVPVNAGEHVKEGAGLVYLDQRRFKSEVDKAEAEVGRLKRVLAEAKKELGRAKELYDRTLLSNHDLEVARIEHATALANFSAAKAALVDARLKLEYSVVRAPFPAVVLQVGAQKGQTVVSRLEAKPLVTVAESGRMIARVVVPEEQVGTLSEGDEATATVAGRKFTGRVARVGLEPANKTRPSGYPVDVLFDYDPAQVVLRAGQKAEVRLP